jgi:uncharacterized protein
MSINDLLKEKRGDILRIASQHGARNVRIFGSVARGEDSPDSDIDLLVHLDPGTTLIRHAALARELKSLLGREVQVVSDRGLRHRIRDRVIQEAIPL